MPFLTTQRGKRLFSVVISLPLAATGLYAMPVITSHKTPVIYFRSIAASSHIFDDFPLYEDRDTTLLDNHRNRTALTGKNGEESASGIIRREKNGDLVIAIPELAREQYRVRFFDDDHHFLFEVRQIKDPVLILEKYNFQHTGLFQYELYRENMLVERSTFLIRKE
jgi:hypothetical protein